MDGTHQKPVNLMWGGADQVPEDLLEPLANDQQGETSSVKVKEVILKFPDGRQRIMNLEDPEVQEAFESAGVGAELAIDVPAIDLPFMLNNEEELVYPYEGEEDTEYLESLPETIEQDGMIFKNIASESFRAYGYVLPDGSFRYIVYDSPIYLYVKPGGGHRLITSDGLSHWIRPDFINIVWMPREGQPNFVL